MVDNSLALSPQRLERSKRGGVIVSSRDSNLGLEKSEKSAERGTPGKDRFLAEIYRRDGQIVVLLNVHQVLMTSASKAVLCYNSDSQEVPYDEISRITLRFDKLKGDD